MFIYFLTIRIRKGQLNMRKYLLLNGNKRYSFSLPSSWETIPKQVHSEK